MTIIDQLMRDESVRLKPYQDTVGKWTIGVGRNLTDNGITTAEAEYMLGNDVYKARQDLLAACPWCDKFDDARFGALINITFNVGIGSLLQFRKALAACQVGDWETAATEFLDSKWAEQVGARAQRLALQLRTGRWQ